MIQVGMNRTIAGRVARTAFKLAAPPAGLSFLVVGLLATFPRQVQPMLDAVGIKEITPASFYMLWAALFALLGPVWFAIKMYPRLEFGCPRADYGEGEVHIRLPIRTIDAGLRKARFTARIYD